MGEGHSLGGPPADYGDSNGSRLRLWKRELQTVADEIGLALAVSHFLPGTSKWNKVEHRLFSFISKNWRGQPLTSLKVSLIAGTTTRKGLKVHAEIDHRSCPTGIKVPDEEMEQINLRRDVFHGEWNYAFTHHDAADANASRLVAPLPRFTPVRDSIPSRRILSIRVVRGIPRRVAAPCRPPRTHFASSSV